LPGYEKAAKFPFMTASVTDLRRKTTELLDEVRRGEAVEIQHHGKTIARLVPEAMPPRQVGRHAGSVLRALREGRPSIPPPGEPEEDIILADRRRRLSD
jgi:prevent-host-death family protein